MSETNSFIVIDDDFVHNAICSLTINLTLEKPEVKAFELPEEGLKYIKNMSGTIASKKIIFLDIYMPALSGWEFLEQYGKLSKEIRQLYSIYILSSSADHCDKEKAATNNLIKGFIPKPLTREIIRKVATQHSDFSSKIIDKDK
jgi:response regulator RpfG family c-di-GMP phosphodiesterase